MADAMVGHAREEVAQADELPETVLVTGSLIRGTTEVGVPVTRLTPQDFATTGALTTADLFRTVPAAVVLPGPVGTAAAANIGRGTKVMIRGLDVGSGPRSLLMIDGMRFPLQSETDPSIIPALSMDHIDVLVDGASATYGSDAVSGVINIILKRNMDGAITQARLTGAGDKNRYAASAVWGRMWDGGQVTLSYEWYNETPIRGNYYSKFGLDHTPWGLDDRRPIGSSAPATLSIGTPVRRAGGNVGTSAQFGHGCTNCYAVPLGTGQDWEPTASGIGPTAPFSASTINWSSFNNLENAGTNGLRNQFDPYDIAWYDAAQERNGGHITVDQMLTGSISFYGSGFYSNRRARFLNPSNSVSGIEQHSVRSRRTNLQSLLSERQCTGQFARQLQHWDREPEFYRLSRNRPSLSVGLEHRASTRLERPCVVRDDRRPELQQHTRIGQQIGGVGGVGLDRRRYSGNRQHACDCNLVEARERSLSQPLLRSRGLSMQRRVLNRVHPGRSIRRQTTSGSTKRASRPMVRCSICPAVRSKLLSGRRTRACGSNRRSWTILGLPVWLCPISRMPKVVRSGRHSRK